LLKVLKIKKIDIGEDSMAEIGQVVEIDNNSVVVKLERQEACAKCRACTAGLSKTEMIIKAINCCNAKIDDNVEIVIEESNFIQAVLIMYGIPFVSLMIGIFIGYYGSLKLGMQNNDIIGFCFGILLVIISYLWIKSKENYWKSKNFVPKAIKIADKN